MIVCALSAFLLACRAACRAIRYGVLTRVHIVVHPRFHRETLRQVLARLLWPRLLCPGLSVLLAFSSCANPQRTRLGTHDPDVDYADSLAHPAAYGADGMAFRKEQLIRPANDFEFYFKNCELGGPTGYYSKTSYWCTDP